MKALGKSCLLVVAVPLLCLLPFLIFIFVSEKHAAQLNSERAQLRRLESVLGINSDKPLTPNGSAALRLARTEIDTMYEGAFERSLEKLRRERNWQSIEPNPVDFDDTFRDSLREEVNEELPEVRGWLSSRLPRVSQPEPNASHPTAVALYASNSNAPHCSGVVIGPRTVLTAAHCTCGAQLAEARLGEATQPRRLAMTSIPISEFARKSSCNDYFRNGDLAVLRLGSKVPNAISPALLPTAEDYVAFNSYLGKLLISGYGPYAGHSGRRLGGTALVASHDCSGVISTRLGGPHQAKKISEHYGCLPHREIVIDRSLHAQKRATGTCTGDSGGPGYSNFTSENDVSPVLLSVTSRSVPTQRGCSDASILVKLTQEDVAWIRSKASETLP